DDIISSAAGPRLTPRARLESISELLRTIEGFGVLLLLSAFFAYMIAPVVPAVQRRIRPGRRQRPLSKPWALTAIYGAVLAPGVAGGQASQTDVANWVRVTAPTTVDHLFSGRSPQPFERVAMRLPLPATWKPRVVGWGEASIAYLEREVRSTLGDLIEAARYAAWLLVAPVLAFILLAWAPAFQRSALRVLPRGHLQWRAEEYFRDVNSALAGYVRAQAAAGVIVGTLSVVGFSLIGLPSAVSMGVASGVLELVPAIGPL